MPEVQTVTGPVPASELGHTQPHEHVFVDLTWADRRWDLVLLDDVDQMREEVSEYGKGGGGCLVDLTCSGIGRKPEALKAISEETGVHIVMGAGWYRAPFYPPDIDRLTTRALAERLVEEIRYGVGTTGIRPGIIGEIGTDKRWMQGVEERVFRAAARAHRETGLAISTHTPPYAAVTQLEVLMEEDVDPRRVIVGHCDNTLNREYLQEILDTGANIEFDTIGVDWINSDERRADMIMELIRDGYQEQILLSLDVCARPRLKTNGGDGYSYLQESFMPLLLGRGLDEADVVVMTQDNPQRMLVV